MFDEMANTAAIDDLHRETLVGSAVQALAATAPRQVTI